MHRYGISHEEGKRVLAKIAVKNHHNGMFAPKAHFHKEVTEGQVINAPLICWPLGLFDCCGTSDGAAAAIITTPELAKSFKKDYILVKGFGMVCGSLQAQLQDDYDMTHFEEAYRSGLLAYEEADIKDPRKEIDIVQLHDCFTSTELITYEDLQLSPRGKAWEDVNAGTFTLEGELPVNTDGGLKCFGHPIGATGLRQTYENYKQLQGKAEKRQVKDVRMALSHNIGGMPGNFTVGVAIFGRADT